MTRVEGPGLVLGRYEAIEVLAQGSLGSSVVWRGVDNDTGDGVAIKAYNASGLFGPTDALYANEVEAQIDVGDCPQLARMLARDDERHIIVKTLIPGRPRSPTRVTDTRSATRDLLEIAAWTARMGRCSAHALHSSNVIEHDGRWWSVENCSSQRTGWTPRCLEALTTFRLSLLGWSVPHEMIVENAARPYEESARWLDEVVPELKRQAMRELDAEVTAVVEAHPTDPAEMLRRVERLC